MESNQRRRQVLPRKRKPLSDCTNTTSSSSVSFNPNKPNPSSSSSKSPFKKPTTKRTSIPTSNPSFSPPPTLSTPSLKSSSDHGSVDVEASEPISVVYSRRSSSNKRKDKGKEVAIPVSSTPTLKVSNTWEQSDWVEGENLPKAKALTVSPKKKPRTVSSKKDVLKDPQLQDFIEKQKAYFKMIDEFKLPEEEVESIDELD